VNPPSDRFDLYRQALTQWGAGAQLAMVHEEIGELLVCVGHVGRGRATASDLAGEIADVRIMLEQLALIAEIPEADIDAKMRAKLDRLASRLGANDWAGTKSTPMPEAR
jgi:NTP pyrophosphatase (non-canonical NTP hydrolase)